MSRPAIPQMPHIQHSYARPATLLAPEVRAGPMRLMGDEPASADHLPGAQRGGSHRARRARRRGADRSRRRAGSCSTTAPPTARSRSCGRSRPRCRSSTVCPAADTPSCRPCPTASRARPRRAPSTAALADGRLERLHARDEARRRHRAAARLLRDARRSASRRIPSLGIAVRRPRRARRRRLQAACRSRRTTSTARSSATRGRASRRSAACRSGSAGTRSTRPTRACAASRPARIATSWPIHHRPLASADGTLRGRARHGECAYIAHFSLLVGRAARVQGRPLPARGALRARLLLRLRPGGLSPHVERVPDPEFRRFARRELRRRLSARSRPGQGAA